MSRFSDRVEGTAQKIVGAVEETVGRLLHHGAMEAEGAAERWKGDATLRGPHPGGPKRPLYGYELAVEIPPTEAAVLVDALDGEEFSLGERLGKDELARQLEEHELVIDVLSERTWPDFQREIEALSSYLSEPISGRETTVDPGERGTAVAGSIILASRGRSERLALDVDWDEETRTLVAHGIDKDDARRRWRSLPDWVRTSLVNEHPDLEGGEPGR